MGFNTEGEIPCGRCKGDRYDPEPLECCPFDIVGRDVWKALDMAEHAKNGRWPVAGGYLDQTAIFIEACELIWPAQRQLQNARPME